MYLVKQNLHNSKFIQRTLIIGGGLLFSSSLVQKRKYIVISTNGEPVESKLVKLETSCTVILPTRSVLSGLALIVSHNFKFWHLFQRMLHRRTTRLRNGWDNLPKSLSAQQGKMQIKQDHQVRQDRWLRSGQLDTSCRTCGGSQPVRSCANDRPG